MSSGPHTHVCNSTMFGVPGVFGLPLRRSKLFFYLMGGVECYLLLACMVIQLEQDSVPAGPTM